MRLRFNGLNAHPPASALMTVVTTSECEAMVARLAAARPSRAVSRWTRRARPSHRGITFAPVEPQSPARTAG